MARRKTRAVYDYSDRPRFPTDDHLEWLYREALKRGADPDFYGESYLAGYNFDEALTAHLALDPAKFSATDYPKMPAAPPYGSSEHAVFSAGLDARRGAVAEAKEARAEHEWTQGLTDEQIREKMVTAHETLAAEIRAKGGIGAETHAGLAQEWRAASGPELAKLAARARKPSVGRKREHVSAAARQKAYLERNRLVRTSVTVPADKVGELRKFAKRLGGAEHVCLEMLRHGSK